MKIIKAILLIIFLPIVNNVYAHISTNDLGPKYEEYPWKNIIHYFCLHPKYTDHKEPQDIAKNGCKWGVWITFPNKVSLLKPK